MALLTERRMTILVFAVIIVTILGGAAAIYYFQFNVLAEEQKKGKNLDAQLIDAQNKRDKLQELVRRLEELRQKTAQAKAMVPTLDINEYDNFINTLDKIGRTTGVSIPSVKYVAKSGGIATPTPGQKKLPPTVEESNFDLKVYGEFYNVLKFIDLLEKNERFIIVNSYSIAPIKSDAAKLTDRAKTSGIILPDLCELKLKITAYTYKASSQEQKQVENIQQTTPIPD